MTGSGIGLPNQFRAPHLHFLSKGLCTLFCICNSTIFCSHRQHGIRAITPLAIAVFIRHCNHHSWCVTSSHSSALSSPSSSPIVTSHLLARLSLSSIPFCLLAGLTSRGRTLSTTHNITIEAKVLLQGAVCWYLLEQASSLHSVPNSRPSSL